VIRAAAENFSTTYLRLGEVLPAARRVEDDAFTALVGPGLPTIANFAVDLNLDPWSVRRLADLSESPDFRIYRQSTDRPAHAGELLERGGFAPIAHLEHMIAPALDPSVGTEAPILAAPSDSSRAIADFIVSQFLPRGREVERRAMRDTLTGAQDIELFEAIAPSGERIAAAVLSPTDEITGIYNLCVRADRRGNGVGRWFVQALRKSVKTPYICLQCYPKLTSWYRREGFEPVGSVEVFARNSGKVGGY